MEAARVQKEKNNAVAAAREANEQRANEISENMLNEPDSIMEQDLAGEPNSMTPKTRARRHEWEGAALEKHHSSRLEREADKGFFEKSITDQLDALLSETELEHTPQHRDAERAQRPSEKLRRRSTTTTTRGTSARSRHRATGGTATTSRR